MDKVPKQKSKKAISRLTEKVPVAKLTESLQEVENKITHDIEDFDSINYVYIVNDRKQLVGTLSIRDMYRYSGNKLVQEILPTRKLVAVFEDATQEQVAYLAVKNNLHALPVIAKDKTFLGAITADAIISIIHQEGREDLLRTAGIHHSQATYDNVMEIPISKSLWHRLPWLFLGLLGGLLVARMIGFFEDTLEENLILAAFIPLIVYMSDAVGTQMEAFAIRDFAVHEDLNYTKYFFRQLWVVMLIAIISCLAFWGLGWVLYENIMVTTTMAIALFVAINSSVLTGLLIPLLFRKFKMDPANASGPMATILQNVISIAIYFFIAGWLL